MPSRKSAHLQPAKKTNPHRWLFESMQDLPTFVEKRMFGALAGYLNGMLVLVLCDSEEPWRGVMVPAEKDFHAAIVAEFPALAPHPILGKWLYLPEAASSFERDAQKIVECIRLLDPRFGTVPVRNQPKPRKPARKKRS